MKYPIKTIEYHTAALEELDLDPDNTIQIKYHVTAIAALQYGDFHELGGPGTEVDGRPKKAAPELQLSTTLVMGPEGPKGSYFFRTIPEEV